MRIGDEYLRVQRDDTGWRIERHRDHDDFWRAVILAFAILIIAIVVTC